MAYTLVFYGGYLKFTLFNLFQVWSLNGFLSYIEPNLELSLVIQVYYIQSWLLVHLNKFIITCNMYEFSRGTSKSLFDWSGSFQ